MNRTIKFRAWDGKKMYFFHFWEMPVAFSKKWNVMQFTGLLDKNGKEIYEGDILLNAGQKLRSEGVFFHENKAAFYAWWRYNTPRPDQRKDAFSGGYLGTDGMATCEIIGNIHENPDLLTPSLSVEEKEV
jgi:uncharacterized phage protein (TIGR01671 family)